MCRKRILLAVTADQSLGLMAGFPEYLVEHGWDVHVVSTPGPRAAMLEVANGITYHPISMAREPAPGRDLVSLWRWLQVLASARPDVVASGTPKAGLLGIVAAAILRVPDRVYVVRGLRLETTAGWRRGILTLLERWTFRASTRSLAVSSSLRDEVTSLRLVKARKVDVLGRGSSNGVDLAKFYPRDSKDVRTESLRQSIGLRKELPVVGFVGRLSPDKGLSLLTSALRMMADDGVGFQLLVIGDDEGAAAGLAGVSFPIVRTGAVTDTSSYYPLMDVLCLPTMREGFPNVVLEAAACGIPSVTTNATGAVDSVLDGETGRIVDKARPDELALALTDLLVDPSTRYEMGNRARAWVAHHFAQDEVWARMEGYLAAGPPNRCDRVSPGKESK